MPRRPRSTNRPGLCLALSILVLSIACGAAPSPPQPPSSTESDLPDGATATTRPLPPAPRDGAGDGAPGAAMAQGEKEKRDAIVAERADGGGAPAEPDGAPAFVPRTLGDGLVLLLDAKTGVTMDGDMVARWADQSGKGNHALGVAGRMPALATNASGLPFVRFSGKANASDTSGTGGPYLRISDSPSLLFGRDDFQMVFVASYSNATDKTHMGAVGAFFAKWSSALEMEFAGNWPVGENPNVEKSFLFTSFGDRQPPNFSGCDGSPVKPCEGLNDGNTRVYTLERVGDTLYTRWNGQRAGRKRAYAGANLDVKADAFIGSMYIAGSANHGGKIVSNKIVHALKGDVYLVAVHKGVLPDADLMAFERSLMERFSITP